MDTKTTLYEIVIEGQLDNGWSEWFEPLSLLSPIPSTTMLRGELPDQAALFGILKKLHNLGLVLISVQRVTSDAKGYEHERDEHHR
jgi:hypothetical protein